MSSTITATMFSRFVYCLLLTTLLAVGSASAEDYSEWNHSQTITINTSGTGAYVSGSVTNFPLLLRLRPETFSYFSQTLPGGADIRFAKTDGTHLPYQIERWVDNSSNLDTAEIWVKIDTIRGNTATQSFIMYWGKADAVDSSLSSRVFTPADGFLATYHLAANLLNATSNTHHGMPLAIPTTDTGNGIIGHARSFGGNTCFQIDSLPKRTSGTISFWFRPAAIFNNTSVTTQGIWGKTSSESVNSNISLRGSDFTSGTGTTGQIQTKSEFETTAYYNNSTMAVYNANIWYHFSWSWGNGTDSLYINGTLESARTSTVTIDAAARDEVGRAHYDASNIENSGPRYFTGTLDEFRIDKVPRSPHWAKLSFENQKQGQKLLSFVPIIINLITTEPEDIQVSVGQTASFSVTATGKGVTRYTWQRSPSDSVGNDTTLVLPAVSLDDFGTQYRCIVSDVTGSDTSRWAILTVIDTVITTIEKPSITTQPIDVSCSDGSTAVMSLVLSDTSQALYSWHKTGSEQQFGTKDTMILESATFADSGDYYCVVKNPGGTTISDTVHLSIRHQKPKSAFIFAPKSGRAPLQVAFADASINTVTTRYWDFGDGEHDTVSQPTHTYVSPGLYSVTLITTNPGGSDTLTKVDSVNAIAPEEPIVHAITIDTFFYDSVSRTAKISWCIDSASLTKNPEIAISYSNSTIAPVSPGTITLPLNSRCSDTTLPISDLSLRDSLCTIALWLRLSDNSWIKPTAYSQRTIRIAPVLQEVITIFDSTKSDDTVTAFFGSVIIWKDATYTNVRSITDTLKILDVTESFSGMILLGVPVTFSSGALTDSLYIGFRIDSLPEGWHLQSVHIYSYSGGILEVNYATHIDTVHQIVYIKTTSLGNAYMAMIDITAPQARLYGTINTPIRSNKTLRDTLSIIDNISNVNWFYYYGKGSEIPRLRISGNTKTSGTPLRLEVPDTSDAICPLSGFRAMLIIEDGCTTDTFNLSRPVYRTASDSFTTNANVWNPVYATAKLDTIDVSPLASRLTGHFKVKSYDPAFMRLYRWFTNDNSSAESNHWVEYAPDVAIIRSAFELEPGRLFWLKTSEPVPVHLGPGVTMSLRDTFTTNLPAEQWTDFGMPYRFGVRISDILTATGANADKLQIYRWEMDSATKRYALEPYYVPGMPDKSNASTTIEHLSRGGYSIYNRHTKAISLRIPPVLSASTAGLAKGSLVTRTSWSIKFIVHNSSRTQPTTTYLGYDPAASEQHYPLAPTFSNYRVAVLNRETSQQFGHSIDNDAQGGLFKEILLSNSSDTQQTFSYTLEQTGAFPESFAAACYDVATGRLGTSGTVTVPPQSSLSRWIVAGDADFRQKTIADVSTASFSVLPLFPNPSRSIVNIRYIVPFGAREKVTITIYNILGKKIWQQPPTGILRYGLNHICWNGSDEAGKPAGSGLYFVTIRVNNESGKTVSQTNRSVTIVR